MKDESRPMSQLRKSIEIISRYNDIILVALLIFIIALMIVPLPTDRKSVV